MCPWDSRATRSPPLLTNPLPWRDAGGVQPSNRNLPGQGRRLLLALAFMASLSPSLADAKRSKKTPKRSAMEEGVAQLNNMEDRKALDTFIIALKETKEDDKVASIHIYMGMAHFNLLDQAAARMSFREALKLRPKTPLPANVSPKIRELFQQVKDKVNAEMAAKLKRKSKPKPKPKPKKPPPPKDDGRGAYRASAWVMLGVAVAAAGAGVGLGLTGRSLASDAEDLSLPYAEARDLHDQASTRYLVTNILIGVAGAAAVTSGVLLYFGYRGQPEAQVALVPLQGGALVQVGGVRW